jgi:hypothetical protein
MRILSRVECETWCRDHSISLHDKGWLRPDFSSPDFRRVKIPYEGDSGRKVWLARLLYSFIPPAPETLLWIQDFEVWPSSQHLPLFTRFREAFGEQRSLCDAPGHLVTASDSDDSVSIIATSLLFLWDCYGITASGDSAFHVSHDEYCWFATRERDLAAKVAELTASIQN